MVICVDTIRLGGFALWVCSLLRESLILMSVYLFAICGVILMALDLVVVCCVLVVFDWIVGWVSWKAAIVGCFECLVFELYWL